MKSITTIILLLLSLSVSAKELHWQNSGYKQYSTDLYQTSTRQSAHWLARDFSAKRNCKENDQFASFDECYRFIMALHYTNDAAQR